MINEDTVVAQATPHGQGSISVVRISGKESLLIAKKISKSKNTLMNRQASLRSIFLSEEKKIDKAIFLFFEGPSSYTGEDVVEISCHGNPFIVESIINFCCENGARIAEPGEFTKRAFLNKKLDLVQAEAVGDLISAKSRDAALHQNKNLLGFVSSEISDIKESLLNMLSSIEFELDISESEENLSQAVENHYKCIKNNTLRVKSVLKTYKMGLAYTSGIRIVLVGKPNVGKSTLMNQILKTNRSITSPISGTTRDTVTSEVIISGVPATIIDTAGITKSNNPIEKEGVLRTSSEIKKANLIISLSAPNSDEILVGFPKKTISVFNKADIEKPNRKKKGVFYISALKGTGVKDLIKEVEKRTAYVTPSSSSTINNLRQKEALRKSSASLSRALTLLGKKPFVEFELVAFEIRSSINHLEVFLGKISSEDVLNRVFSGFCVGK